MPHCFTCAGECGGFVQILEPHVWVWCNLQGGQIIIDEWGWGVDKKILKNVDAPCWILKLSLKHKNYPFSGNKFNRTYSLVLREYCFSSPEFLEPGKLWKPLNPLCSNFPSETERLSYTFWIFFFRKNLHFLFSFKSLLTSHSLVRREMKKLKNSCWKLKTIFHSFTLFFPQSVQR